MIIFVAGGTGFVGSKVVELLEKEGHEVILHHRKAKTVPTYADMIVNCVGIIKETTQSFQSVHVEKTKWLVGLGKKLKVRQFVQISAIGADLEGTPYQRTKRQGELLVEQSGLPYMIIRPSLIFGPGKSAVEVFRKICRTGFFPLFGNGSVQPVHVEIVAKIVLAALQRRMRNRIVELGGPEIFTYRQLAERIHPGVTVVKLIPPLKWMFFLLAFFIPPLPTRDMVRMMEQDNTTTDKTVWKLNIPNPKVA